MNAKTMAIIKFTVAGILLTLTSFWMMKSSGPFELRDYSVLGVLIIIIVIPIYSGIKALKNAREGLNPVDELSKTIQVHAAAKAFHTSIFVWLIIMFALDFFDIDSVNKAKLVVAIGMVITFFIYLLIRLYLSKVGIFDENKD